MKQIILARINLMNKRFNNTKEFLRTERSIPMFIDLSWNIK